MRKNINKKINALQNIKLRHEGLITITNKRNEFNVDNMNERDLRRIYGEKKNTNIETNNNLEYYYETCNYCKKIGVMIVNLNNIKYTENCIKGLLNQTNKNFKIYIIDQNSDEIGTDKFLDDCINNNMVVIKNKNNIPLNYVWNSFKEITDCEYLCFLNNDVEITPNFIDDTLNVFLLNCDVAAVIHVTNNKKYFFNNNKLEYEILNPPKYQGWDFTIKRELYPEIPKQLLIFGGDDYIFAKLNTDNHKIAMIYSSPIIHYKEKTRCMINNIREIQTNDAKSFWKLVNDNKLIHCTSTMDSGLCGKYPPIDFKLTQNKKCIYTACIGDYDYLSPIKNKLDDWDYICYTDNLKLKSDFWKIIYVENINNSLYNNTKMSRYFKTNFYNYLSSYDIIMWIDSRIIIDCDLNKYALNLDNNYDIVMVKHNDANSISDEFDRVLSGKLECVEMVNLIKDRYSKFCYPYNNELIASGILLFKNNKKTIKFFSEWWYEIKNYSNRDQLSANFVLWRNNEIKYKIMPNVLGNLFKQNKRRKKRLYYE